MKTRVGLVMLLVVLLLAGTAGAQQVVAQAGQAPGVRKMDLTGEIAKARNAYVIRSRRGNAPSEIFTILNADPKILDELVKSGKTVPLEVQVVSGDNVRIEKLDGKAYP